MIFGDFHRFIEPDEATCRVSPPQGDVLAPIDPCLSCSGDREQDVGDIDRSDGSGRRESYGFLRYGGESETVGGGIVTSGGG